MITMTRDTDEVTVAEARSWLASRMTSEEEVLCPCCQRVVRPPYRKYLTPMLAKVLDWLLGYGPPGTPINVVEELRREGRYDESKQYSSLRLWGFIEPVPSRGKGWWAVTGLGLLWRNGALAAPECIRVLNGRPVGEEGVWIRYSDLLPETE